jgi:hypothetical protein
MIFLKGRRNEVFNKRWARTKSWLSTLAIAKYISGCWRTAFRKVSRGISVMRDFSWHVTSASGSSPETTARMPNTFPAVAQSSEMGSRTQSSVIATFPELTITSLSGKTPRSINFVPAGTVTDCSQFASSVRNSIGSDAYNSFAASLCCGVEFIAFTLNRIAGSRCDDYHPAM